jgi:hypothetical protein
MMPSMRTRTAALLALAISAAAALHAQTAPPVKMGLWDGTTSTAITGMNLPPEVAERLKAMGRPVPGSEPRIMQTQSCLTPEKWKEMLTRAQDRQNCQLTNLKQDSSRMSADISCGSSTGSSAKGHLDMIFISSEKIHGTLHIEAISPRQPQPIILNTTIDSTYQGADCKGVSPDTPKIIMK